MNKYRLGYDEVFSADPLIKLGSETLFGVSIFIKYRLFDLNTGFEIAFDEEEQAIGIKVRSISDYAELGGIYMNDFIDCTLNIDFPDFIRIKKIDKEKLKQLGYRLEYEIASYHKDVVVNEYLGEPVEITKEEFYRILKENISNFDSLDSASQSCSCKTYPIEEIAVT
jgi:outer membrane protease